MTTPRRPAPRILAAALLWAASAGASGAQPAIPSWMGQASADAESLPTSRAMVAALSALAKPAMNEATLKTTQTSSARTSFKVAGQDFALSATSSADLPRRAASATGPGVAILVKLPETTAGLTSGDPERDAKYALATVVGTRISLWAFYSRTPSDGVLSRRMLAALARLGPPLATIDPAFQPTLGVGAAGYVLK